jgi:hypothetical protein
MKTHHLLSVLLTASLVELIACGGSVAGGGPGTSTRHSTILEYVNGCTPAACADLSAPEVGCDPPGATTSICKPAAGGTCVIEVECGPPTVCDPGACGPEPFLPAGSGCPAGSTGSVACTGTSPGTCEWTLTCSDGKDAGSSGDGGTCVDIVPSSYDQSCTTNSDCIIISAGELCSNDGCRCGGWSINKSDEARYEKAVPPVAPGAMQCECPLIGHPKCVHGTCHDCGGLIGPHDPACSDGG